MFLPVSGVKRGRSYSAGKLTSAKSLMRKLFFSRSFRQTSYLLEFYPTFIHFQVKPTSRILITIMTDLPKILAFTFYHAFGGCQVRLHDVYNLGNGGSLLRCGQTILSMILMLFLYVPGLHAAPFNLLANVALESLSAERPLGPIPYPLYQPTLLHYTSLHSST